MKLSEEEAKPCPFCGKQPVLRKTKVRHCQLHGEPYQDVYVACASSQCFIKPKTNEEVHKEHALEQWNRRGGEGEY